MYNMQHYLVKKYQVAASFKEKWQHSQFQFDKHCSYSLDIKSHSIKVKEHDFNILKIGKISEVHARDIMILELRTSSGIFPILITSMLSALLTFIKVYSQKAFLSYKFPD